MASFFLTSTSVGLAGAAVELEGWEGPAVLISNRGPGAEYFRLVARARWDQPAVVPGESYSLQIGLPDGVRLQQVLGGGEAPGSPTLTLYVSTDAVLDRAPSAVRVRVRVVGANGLAISNVLDATI